MKIVDNLEKVVDVTCDCGTTLIFGIDDVNTKGRKKFIVCPRCDKKLYLRDDVKKYIALHGN